MRPELAEAAQPDASPPLRPACRPVFFLFISSHLIYIWADANFYRPITMQRANLPLSYPMTARRFLEKHGLLDAGITSVGW